METKRKVITVELSTDQIAWLDQQAANLSVSRAAYLRTILSLLRSGEPLAGLISSHPSDEIKAIG